MKYLIYMLLLSTLSLSLSAQKIKIKKNIVYVDDKECLKVSGDANNVSFYDLDGNEIVFLKYFHDTKYASLYNKITFVNQKKSFTSKDYIYTRKLLVSRLIKNFILVNCKLDETKIDNFIMKYDENVEKDVEKIIIRETTNDSNVDVQININR